MSHAFTLRRVLHAAAPLSSRVSRPPRHPLPPSSLRPAAATSAASAASTAAAAATAAARGLASSPRSSPQADADYYAVLGVSRGASSADIKKAYYAAAKNLHPDTSGGDAAAFARLGAAYETLRDDRKRRIYDAHGVEGVRAAEGGDGWPAGEGGGAGMGAASMDDILREFGQFFGGGGGGVGGGMGGMGGTQRRAAADDPMGGQDRQVGVALSLKEAAFGAVKRVRVDGGKECNECNGSGKREATRVEKCEECGGAGRVRRGGGGMFQTVIMVCGSCGGVGEVMEDPCKRCAGAGRVAGEVEREVNIPAGCESGMVLRVPGGGGAGVRRGPAGDLFIQVHVEDDGYFERDGRNLHVVAPISIAQAALGGEVEVQTLEGAERVKVRGGTQPDDTVTMGGRGVRGVNDARRGDQVVHFKVVVPEAVAGRKRELLKELMEMEGGKITRREECESRGLLQRFQRFLRGVVAAGK